MNELEAPKAKPSESASLGMEMAAAFAHMVEFYGKHYGMTTQEAVDKVNEPPADGTSVLKFRPDQLTWMTFAELTKGDPERAAKLWEQLQEIHRNELQNGHRAAKVVEVGTSSPAERVKFIVLREGLAEEWKPRNGIEWTLIDTMAHAFTAYEFWMMRGMIYSMLECDNPSVKAAGKWKSPSVSDSDAINQAAAMADRFNRIFMRSLRALRDLRRYSPTIVVQNAGQVNVGEQQVNVG